MSCPSPHSHFEHFFYKSFFHHSKKWLYQNMISIFDNHAMLANISQPNKLSMVDHRTINQKTSRGRKGLTDSPKNIQRLQYVCWMSG
jgi:hypothetical protein